MVLINGDDVDQAAMESWLDLPIRIYVYRHTNMIETYHNHNVITISIFGAIL